MRENEKINANNMSIEDFDAGLKSCVELRNVEGDEQIQSNNRMRMFI